MSDAESRATSDTQALRLLDDYHASLLGCPPADLRRPGWTTVRARSEGDPMALLFGMRSLVNIIAPVAAPGDGAAGPAAVAALAPEMREPVAELLRAIPPEHFFTPAPLKALREIVWTHTREPLSPASEARLALWYVTRGRYQAQITQWMEWIERLDEATENDPFAIALLARHGGGVFVVRERGAIIAYIGLRAHSPHVWEILEPALTGRASAAVAEEPRGLVTALVARATRFALEDGRQPLCAAGPSATLWRRALMESGYRPYANASVFTTAMR